MTDVLARLASALADHYLIDRELGAGGMATVFLARDLKHDRAVAVKVLRPELGAVLGIERFLSEIRVTAHLQHPHILPLFDSGNAGGLIWYAMPYVEGESLRDKLQREKQLSIEEALGIAVAVASALDHAHRHDVIHRDIKPENILLQDGQPVVADFGIALALTAAAGNRLTETGLSLGTPQYMSPEQATGERMIDRRTDIYSLGCVVYEMLAGDPPFTGSTVQAVLAQVVTDRPRRLSILRETVPPHVEAALAKALAKVPADRFATAAEFSEGLMKPGLVALLPELGAPPVAAGRRSPDNQLVRWRFGAALLTVGTVIGGLAMGILGALRQRTSPPIAPVARFSLDVSPVAAGTSSIAVSPDGSQIVYAATDSQQTTHLFRRPLDHTESVLLQGTQGATQPFLSPDGLSVGFYQDNKLRRMPIAGGEISTICDAQALAGASWGFADIIVFVASWRGRGSLFRVSALGGEPELLLTPDTNTLGGPNDIQHFRRPDLLADGSTVLFTMWGTIRPVLAALSLPSRRLIPLAQLGDAPHYVNAGYVVFFDGGFKVRRFDTRRVRFVGPSQPFAPGPRSQLSTDFGAFGISRNGTAAFLGGSAPLRDLVIVNRLGGLDLLPVAPDYFTSPKFSPDGRSILVRTTWPVGPNAGDLWTYDMTLHTLERLTFDSASASNEWAPDGRRVIYAGHGALPGDWDLRWIAADRSGTSQILLARPGSQWQGLLTPDARTLVFFEWAGATQQDVLIAPLDSPQAARQVSPTTGNQRSIALSPDGRLLAYVSEESGTVQVYVRALAPGSGRRQVSQGANEPLWAPSGRELFFRRGDSLYAVPVTQGRELQFGAPRALFGGPLTVGSNSSGYSIHPDGQRLVFVRTGPDERNQIQVLLHWFEHLRAPR